MENIDNFKFFGSTTQCLIFTVIPFSPPLERDTRFYEYFDYSDLSTQFDIISFTTEEKIKIIVGQYLFLVNEIKTLKAEDLKSFLNFHYYSISPNEAQNERDDIYYLILNKIKESGFLSPDQLKCLIEWLDERNLTSRKYEYTQTINLINSINIGSNSNRLIVPGNMEQSFRKYMLRLTKEDSQGKGKIFNDKFHLEAFIYKYFQTTTFLEMEDLPWNASKKQCRKLDLRYFFYCLYNRIFCDHKFKDQVIYILCDAFKERGFTPGEIEDRMAEQPENYIETWDLDVK